MNVKYYYYGTKSSSQRNKRAVGQPQNIDLEVTQKQVDNAHITVRSCARYYVVLIDKYVTNAHKQHKRNTQWNYRTYRTKHHIIIIII